VRTAGPDGARVTFGRAEGAPYRHVQLREPTVSRAHAEMTFHQSVPASNGSGSRGTSGTPARWRLENLSSTNPVVINGRSLDANGGATASACSSQNGDASAGATGGAMATAGARDGGRRLQKLWDRREVRGIAAPRPRRRVSLGGRPPAAVPAEEREIEVRDADDGANQVARLAQPAQPHPRAVPRATDDEVKTRFQHEQTFSGYSTQRTQSTQRAGKVFSLCPLWSLC